MGRILPVLALRPAQEHCSVGRFIGAKRTCGGSFAFPLGLTRCGSRPPPKILGQSLPATPRQTQKPLPISDAQLATRLRSRRSGEARSRSRPDRPGRGGAACSGSGSRRHSAADREWAGWSQRPHPLAQPLRHGLETGLIETIDSIDHERRQHVVARIIEDPVIDRKQQVVDRPVDPRAE